MTTKHTQVALVDPVEWLGDWHPLAEQLGSADGLLEIGAVAEHLSAGPVHDLPSLRDFLAHYHRDILFPFEMPAIEAAHRHALGNELRELVALDQQLASRQILESLAGASRRVGRAQLQKLRPLRDQKLVRRYLEFVMVSAVPFSNKARMPPLVMSLLGKPDRERLNCCGGFLRHQRHD